ncbi:hypothetical protein D1AOALGA4SA_2322 [Olavius algarvensis Delta 1 endosymbiont]|nr:hypothetical protein D1AOALGA4SA_2322 [Olavius algarvensis Delta 1 endosymbiont]
MITGCYTTVAFFYTGVGFFNINKPVVEISEQSWYQRRRINQLERRKNGF